MNTTNTTDTTNADMKLPQIETVPITQVKPYHDNPRKIPAEAVAAVKESIDNFGYVQPIVVNTDFVIIAGHTRHKALTELGYTTVDILVSTLSDDDARAYRVADNRLGELSGWDHDQLVAELLDLESSYLNDLFPEIDLELAEVSGATQGLSDSHDTDTRPGLQCPSCDHAFAVNSDFQPLAADTD